MKNTILLISFLLMGSQLISSQSKAGDLPVIDFSKNYPEKKICLQDIAETQYVPLETTDDILLSEHAKLVSVSDKYILVYEPLRGDIFIFDGAGKIYSNFNRKGSSGQEYAWIRGLIFDEKNEEIFVCNTSIQVYSLKGEHKRTLRVNTLLKEMSVYNFDDQSLLVYEDINVEPDYKGKINERPYSLISKKDGSLISVLGIHLSKRYSNRIAKKEGNTITGTQIGYQSNIHYGQDFMIADISSDTLFLLNQNKKIIPILIGKPSVHISEPRSVLVVSLTTDRFIILGKIPLDFNKKSGKSPSFMYEFDTRKISTVAFTDAESVRGKWHIWGTPIIEKNKFAELIQPSLIKKADEKRAPVKALRALSEDDNPIVRILKFK